MRKNPLFDFSQLSAAERIELAQDLWDSLDDAEIDAELPLSEEQRVELDRRLAELEANPDAGRPWEEVRAELEAKLKNAWKGRRGA